MKRTEKGKCLEYAMASESIISIDERVDQRSFNDAPNRLGVVEKNYKYSPAMLANMDFFDSSDLSSILSASGRDILKTFDEKIIDEFRAKMAAYIKNGGTVNNIMCRNDVVSLSWVNRKKEKEEVEIKMDAGTMKTGLRLIYTLYMHIGVPKMFQAMLDGRTTYRVDYDIGNIAKMSGYLEVPMLPFSVNRATRLTAGAYYFARTRMNFEQLLAMELTGTLKQVLPSFVAKTPTKYPYGVASAESDFRIEVETRPPFMWLQVKNFDAKKVFEGPTVVFFDDKAFENAVITPSVVASLPTIMPTPLPQRQSLKNFDFSEEDSS